MSRAGGTAALCALLVCGCTDLPDLGAGTCGNGIVEGSEDCDTKDQTTCGAPNSEHACRLICDPETNPPSSTCNAAQGYVCSLDGVCRKPTGQFAPSAPIPGLQQLSVRAGDVDGDGIDDIVTVNRGGWLRVMYFESDGTSKASSGFQTSPMPAIVGQLSDSDSNADIVHLADRSVGVLLGSQERQLEPVAYASLPVTFKDPRYFSIDAVLPQLDNPFAEVVSQDEILSLTNGEIGNTIPPEPLFKVPYDSSKLVNSGSVLVGNLDERPDSPCQEFVLAQSGDPFVSVYTPCTAKGYAYNKSQTPLATVSLPTGATVGESAFLTQLNGDAHLDLVIAGAENLYAAFGVGDGTFHSDPNNLPTAGQGDNKAVTLPLEQTKETAAAPLAVGDLNGDKIADLVFPAAIAFSTPGLCALGGECWGLVVKTDLSWSLATIVDLNGNGWPDLVAVRKDSLYIDFWDGTSTGSFTASAIALNGAAHHLVIGDFDGDFSKDIAIDVVEDSESPPGIEPASSDRHDGLAVLFGRAHGPPEPPVSMGKLGTIRTIVGGHFAFLSGPDVPADLTVLSADGANLSVALFPGNSNRQLQAPFSLATNTSQEPDQAFTDAVGNFAGDSHMDIAALAIRRDQIKTESRLWLLPSTGEADLSTSTANPNDWDLGQRFGIDPCTVSLVPINLDQDGPDELVLFGQPTAPGQAMLLIARSNGEKWTFTDDPIRVSGLTFAANIGSLSVCRLLEGSDEGEQSAFFQTATQTEVVDVDADGNPEIVMLTADDSGQPQSTRLAVFSTASLADPILLTPPTGWDIRAFVVLDPAAKPPTLVVATSLGTKLAKLDLSAQSIEAAGDLDPSPVPGAHPALGPSALLHPFLGAVRGDFNGDRIPDVLVGREDGFQIYMGIPVKP